MSQALLKIEQIPLGSSRVKLFADFPWRLHQGDPCWTPPLRGDLLGNRLLGLVGLLTPEHPYHRYAEVTHFLAWRDGKVVGRISAAINHRFNEYHDTRIGFFGFWDVIADYAIASVLLGQACDWVKDRGMQVIRGPGEYSNATHERQGVLVEGFEYPPTVELTHNPPYYGEYITIMPAKPRRPGRPRAIPEQFEPILVDLYNRGYGYRAIARILSSPEYGLNPHFSSVRLALIRLGIVKSKAKSLCP